MSEAIALRDEAASWAIMQQRAALLLKSGFLPKAIRTPEQALAVMQTGQELGLGPMQALRSIHVIEGKPALSAELMAALVFRHVPGATLRVAVSTNHECEVRAARPGTPETVFKFTIHDAQVAGVASKDVWRKYPRAMLRSRCVSEAVRAIFPDASMGLYTPEELGGEVAIQEMEPASLEPETTVTVVEPEPAPKSEPPKALPPKIGEPFRFKSGERAGEAITEVPTDYLQRLYKHPLRADIKRRVADELERRNTSEYIAAELQKSIDAAKAKDDSGPLPASWGGPSECPECEAFDKDCALCFGTGKPSGGPK